MLVAEAIAHFYPRLVELHNYSSANSLSQKMYNWNTLNTKAGDFYVTPNYKRRAHFLSLGNSTKLSFNHLLHTSHRYRRPVTTTTTPPNVLAASTSSPSQPPLRCTK